MLFHPDRGTPKRRRGGHSVECTIYHLRRSTFLESGCYIHTLAYIDRPVTILSAHLLGLAVAVLDPSTTRLLKKKNIHGAPFSLHLLIE